MTGKQNYRLNSITHFLLILRFCSISYGFFFFKEPEFMSGEEFLRSIEARLTRMEEIANAFHDYQTDNFRRELEDKQLRPSVAKVRVIT